MPKLFNKYSNGSYNADDLKIIEGIGPKIEQLLFDAGILTWEELAMTDIHYIKQVLAGAGSRFKMHDPTTWPRQAQLIIDGKWKELENYQTELVGGREK